MRGKSEVNVEDEKDQQAASEPGVSIEWLSERLADAEGYAGDEILEAGQHEQHSVFKTLFVNIIILRVKGMSKVEYLSLNIEEDEDLRDELKDN